MCSTPRHVHGSDAEGSAPSPSASAGTPSEVQGSRRAFILRAAALGGASILLASCDSSPRSKSPTLGPKPDFGVPAGSPRPRTSTPEPVPPPEPVVDLTPPAREPMIRVRVMRRAVGEPVELAAAGSGKQWLRVARMGDDGLPGAVLLVLASPIRISADEQGWIIVDGSGHRSVLDGAEPIEVGATKGAAPAIRIDDATYPGVARLVSRGGDAATESGPTTGMVLPTESAIPARAMDVVNVLPLETYLPGVVAKELYPNWKQETYRAQVVAARSYACFEIAWWRQRRHFDVVAGQASQAYVGRTDSAVANGAVADTRGRLLVFQGKVVPAYYSSACGGLSANAVDAISDHPVNDIQPIRARPPRNCCEWAPVFRWKSEQAGADAATRLMAWTATRPRWRVPRMGGIVEIEPSAVNEFGRPVRYRVSDGRTEVEIPAEPLRMALNHAAGRVSPPRSPVRSGNFTTSARGGTIALAGQGYGHGVGMCQYGAEGMAKGGSRWSEILATYYPGAEVRGAF